RHGPWPASDAAPARSPQTHHRDGRRLRLGRRLRAGPGMQLYRRLQQGRLRLPRNPAGHPARLGRHTTGRRQIAHGSRHGNGTVAPVIPCGPVRSLGTGQSRLRARCARGRDTGLRLIVHQRPPLCRAHGQTGRATRRRTAPGSRHGFRGRMLHGELRNTTCIGRPGGFPAARPQASEVKGLPREAMMTDDNHLDSERELIRDTVRRFAEREIAPQSETLWEDQAFPYEIWKMAGELGFTGLPYPKEYGGGDGDWVSFTIVLEELAR